MRILLSNKFYYPKGGDCIHAIGLEEMLRSNGHEVAFFAMKHPLNLSNDYEEYFPSELDYSNRNIRNLKEQLFRPISSGEVKRKFTQLLDDFRPDILHAHNIHSQISPIIVELANKRNIPVVWSIHDYKLLCPRYDCRRDGKPCELCFKNKWNVVRYQCMKNSYGASLLAYAEAQKWNKEKLSSLTSHFICPSEFIRQKMIEGGFDPDSLTTINNFIDSKQFKREPGEKGDYYCYVGRLSQEKGVETLLKAASEIPEFQLKIVGTGPQYDMFLKDYNYPNIEYCGFKSSDEVKGILSGALFSVMPSECYENNPLAVIESLCLGTPVLGARTGGIPELIEENENGILFTSGDKADLISSIHRLMEMARSGFNSDEIAASSVKKFSADQFYQRIISIYEESIAGYVSSTGQEVK